MSGFDKALLQRETNRQMLADALESKYSTERRNAQLLRLSFLILVGGLGIYAITGLEETGGEKEAKKKKKANPQQILAQMQKQVKRNEQMLIGADDGTQKNEQTSVPLADDPDEVMARAEVETKEVEGGGSFEPGNVPLSLRGDLEKKKSTPRPPGAYENAAPEREKEIAHLRSRAGRRSSPSPLGMYRPATAEETLVHETGPRTKKLSAQNPLYEQMQQAPAHLARETAAHRAPKP